MSAESRNKGSTDKTQNSTRINVRPQPIRSLPNYTLSTVCPSCGAPTIRRACKVGCPRCGFMWDCSEL